MAHTNKRAVLMFVALAVGLAGSRNLVAQDDVRGWSTPENLGAVVNSRFNDRFPALSPDGLRLYFQSNRPGGLGADDIYVARRDSPHAPWGTPVNLGTHINSSSDERAPK